MRQTAEIYEKEYEFELAVANLKEAARLFELEKFNKSDFNKANIKIAELLSRDCDNASEAQLVESVKVYFISLDVPEDGNQIQRG